LVVAGKTMPPICVLTSRRCVCGTTDTLCPTVCSDGHHSNGHRGRGSIRAVDLGGTDRCRAFRARRRGLAGDAGVAATAGWSGLPPEPWTPSGVLQGPGPERRAWLVSTFSRCPLRQVVRVSVYSPHCAPMCVVASASISSCSSCSATLRTSSSPSGERSDSNSRSRSGETRPSCTPFG